MAHDGLVDLFNKNNQDHELKRKSKAASRRSDRFQRLLWQPMFDEPDRAWEILLSLVENVDDVDGARGYLGAGPRRGLRSRSWPQVH